MNVEIPFTWRGMWSKRAEEKTKILNKEFYHPSMHQRRSIRLPAYDYASGGAYFVTLCTQQRHPFFGDEALQRVLEEAWRALPHRFGGVTLDEFVIMPNHVHFIIWLHAEREGTPALGTVIAAYKSITTVTWLRLLKLENRRAPGKFWQRNYYEHVLRDEADLAQKRAYIRNNPAKRNERFL